ncbi:MAG: 1-deoxy-D-xylulose-5-phosphate synthase N-terminal domain-containing protein [Candidatus Portnoybacteria bacterium]|nr:1-deoxy-D-xylulose-5-phosphate synthase N-terminal domain-containing protein [Candidatus Portnoybacteria bacterium]MDD4982939.1 1-deoxy-D-xylulose-5-phosphate synthase N-terminal domain-containing protein [Candidatus Portnoybacteria bacterium]
MYNILEQKDLDALKRAEPQRFEFKSEGGVYLNIKGLELAPIEGLDVEKINRLAKIIRGLAFAAIDGIKSGHPGGSSSKVEQLLAMIFSGVMAFDPMAPKNPGRDRVVWSAGHCTPLHHAILALIYDVIEKGGTKADKEILGFDLPVCLEKFRRCDGPSGHVESKYPLADASTGSSGHGLSCALALAMLQKTNGLDGKVFVLSGDAETEEGISYEARNTIVSMGGDNIIVSVDWNGFGIDGPITDVISTPYLNHWLGFGWNVIEVDGHNVLELAQAYKKACAGFGNGRPTAVVCHTIKGKDYGKLEGTADSHGTPAPHPEYVEIMKKLGFDIPGVEGQTADDVKVVLSKLTRDDVFYVLERMEVSKKMLKPESELAEKMKAALAGRPMADYRSIKRPAVLPPELVFKEGEPAAVRKATEAFFKWMMGQSAFFYAGSDDLAKSTLTAAAENIYGIVNAKNPLGRGFRFGIAEPNMAMMSATITQDILPGGFKAMSIFSTYGVFTSMMGNAVRMAIINNMVNPAMNGFFIMLAAHDGPETGEDGPTHQGLFWMALFDAYPGIKVYKPMDANEAVEMLFYAMAKQEPVAFSVMRPLTPVLKRGDGAYGDFTVPAAREAVNGAYVFKPFANNGKRKICLAICGGQSLANTLEILPELEKDSDVKIVAVTSPELFVELRRNNPAKAEEIFSDEDRKIVITIHNGWSGFLDPFMLPADYEKRTLEIDKFLKSGPVADVYKLAQFDPQGILEQIKKAIN